MDKGYHRSWTVTLRGKVLGTVSGATHRAACLRAIWNFKVSPVDQKELVVEREKE
jgi:hypothetical protein